MRRIKCSGIFIYKTYYLILARISDKVLIEKRKRTSHWADFVLRTDHREKIEEIEKYLDHSREQQKKKISGKRG